MRVLTIDPNLGWHRIVSQRIAVTIPGDHSFTGSTGWLPHWAIEKSVNLVVVAELFIPPYALAGSIQEGVEIIRLLRMLGVMSIIFLVSADESTRMAGLQAGADAACSQECFYTDFTNALRHVGMFPRIIAPLR